jgi:hypothetical protein
VVDDRPIGVLPLSTPVGGDDLVTRAFRMPRSLHADQCLVAESGGAVVRGVDRQQINGAARPFGWTKTADEILASVARFCHGISETGHSGLAIGHRWAW